MSGRATGTVGRWTTRRRPRRGRRRSASLRLGVFGGADVQSVRRVCGESGREQHGGGLGGIVRLGGRCAPSGADRVPFAWRLGLHRPGVGLQRPGGRGGAAPRRCGAASGPGGRRGRGVRPAAARGDSGVAVVAERAGDGVSGRRGRDGAAAVDRRIRNSDGRDRLGSCGSVGERSWRRHAGAGRPSGVGALRGDGGRVSGVRGGAPGGGCINLLLGEEHRARLPSRLSEPSSPRRRRTRCWRPRRRSGSRRPAEPRRGRGPAGPRTRRRPAS